MTPSDCQRAAAEFGPAYLALLAQNRGMVDVDGLMLPVPAVPVGDGAASPVGMRLMSYDITDASEIRQAVRVLALGAARAFAHAKGGMLFRLSAEPGAAYSIAAPADHLPCRVTSHPQGRPGAKIEIGIRV